MGFLDWLFGKKPSPKADVSSKSNPLIVVEIIKGASPDQEKIRIAANQGKFTEIGNAEPVCPYCNFKFEKMPQRKKECPYCKKIFYSRTRPLDHKKVLVTTEQLVELEYQIAINNGTFNARQQKNYEDIRREFKEKAGKEPNYDDVMWRFLNKEIRYLIARRDWGLYTNAVLQQAEILNREGKYKQSLTFYLWVCYLDLNGPNNLGGLGKNTEFPGFEPQNGLLPPVIIERAIKLGEILKLSKDEIRGLFFEHNNRIYQEMKLPLTPEDAWIQIENVTWPINERRK